MSTLERALLAAVLVLGLGGAWFIANHHPRSGLEGVHMTGALQLVDQDGRRVGDRELRGKPLVLFFGFTFCPEICPTTLGDMTGWLAALGKDADRLRVAFVTVDPERDTPAKLKTYLSSFDPRIMGLSGPPAAVATLAKAFNVYYAKVPLPNGGYTMDHTAGVFLVDRHGRLVEVIDYGTSRDSALTSLRGLVRRGRGGD